MSNIRTHVRDESRPRMPAGYRRLTLDDLKAPWIGGAPIKLTEGSTFLELLRSFLELLRSFLPNLVLAKYNRDPKP